MTCIKGYTSLKSIEFVKIMRIFLKVWKAVSFDILTEMKKLFQFQYNVCLKNFTLETHVQDAFMKKDIRLKVDIKIFITLSKN